MKLAGFKLFTEPKHGRPLRRLHVEEVRVQQGLHGHVAVLAADHLRERRVWLTSADKWVGHEWTTLGH